MSFVFYGIWGIICFAVSYTGIFWAGWEQEKNKNNWILEEDVIPEIYVSYHKKCKRVKYKYFILGSLAYSVVVSGLHFSCYGDIEKMTTLGSWVTRSITYTIILVSLISQTKIENNNEYNGSEKQKELMELARGIVLAIRKFSYSRIMVCERATYNLFVSDQIQRISKNEDLTNLFILKCQSESWSQTLNISLEEYRENIANRIWQSYVKDDRFNEIVEEIFTIEFHKLNVKIIDIVRTFHNCNEQEVKGKEEKNRKKIQSLIDDHNKIISSYGANNRVPLKEVDADMLKELECSSYTG